MPSNGITAAALIERAVAGDTAALEELLARYREYVRLLLRSRCQGKLRQRVDCSDVVQETLLRAAEHIREFRGRSEPEWQAWLARIAQHEVNRQLRRHVLAGRRALGREQPAASGGWSRLEQWFKTNSSPSVAAMRHERTLQLAQALGRLPEEYRQVLILRHLDGLAFAEIAERLERSAGAVRVLWTRALRKLRGEFIGAQTDEKAKPSAPEMP